jgi:subtilisin-like proprotein convertase family protein
MKPMLLTALILASLGTAQAEVYRGLPSAGEFRPLFSASKSGTNAPALRFGAAMAPSGRAASTWSLRYDARSGRLEARADRAGEMPYIDAGFGQRLKRDGVNPNVLRIGYAADPQGAAPHLTLTTARGVQVLETRGLAVDGGLTVVDASLADGFELSVTLPQGIAPDAMLELALGEAAVVHLQRSGAAGTILRTGDALLCASTGCDLQAAFVAPGGAVGLQVDMPKDSTLRFEGWGQDCRGMSPYTAVLAASERRDYYCVATFSDAATRARSKGNIPTTFSNAAPITIPDSGVSSPNPSTIEVAAFGGLIVDIDVKLENLTHEHPDDLDVLTASPAADRSPVVLMSDACGPTDIVDFDYVFSDEAAAQMFDSSICLPGTYRPTDIEAGDTWASPAPAGPYASALGQFEGINPIGTWRLFVTDDTAGDDGTIPNGWSISVTAGQYLFLMPGAGTSGIATFYPAQRGYFGAIDEIGDVNLAFEGMTHTYPDDLDLLLVSPEGTTVVIMSDACGPFAVTNFFWRFDDEAATVMPDESLCFDFNYRPTNIGSGDVWPAPAPPGPYATSMSAFDGEDPRGNWSLFILDDANGDGGFLVSDWTVEIQGRGVFTDGFEAP